MSEVPFWKTVLVRSTFALVVLLVGSVVSSKNSPVEDDSSESSAVHRLQFTVSWQQSALQDEASVRFFREVPLDATRGTKYELQAESRARSGVAESVFLEGGTYRVVVRAPGAARVVRRMSLVDDAEWLIELEEGRELRVKVLVNRDERLVPLEDATVLVGEPDQTPVGALSDSAGEVRFTQLPRGPVRVRIFAPGFESYEAVTDADLVVRLIPTSVLRVRVQREGKPVAGAQVFIAGVNLWPTRAVRTGTQGSVDISGLSAGTYSLYAQQGDWVSDVERKGEVHSSAGVSEVLLELHPGNPQKVRVLAAKDQRPIEGARVSLRSPGLGEFSVHGLTDRSGAVDLGPLPEPGGWLAVRASGYVPESLKLEDFEADGNDKPEPRVIELEQAATVSGRVVDEQGFPIAGATVEAMGVGKEGEPISVTFRSESVSVAHFDWAREFAAQGVLLPAGELGVLLGPVPPIPLADVPPPEGSRFTSDEKGRFTIVDVPPGDVVVLAHHPNYIDGKSSVLHLASARETSTQVVLHSGKALRGRVLDHRDFPVEGARVSVIGRGFSRRMTTEEGGVFELDAAPDEVGLRIHDPENPLRVLFAKEVGEKERDEELVVVLPEPREDSTITVVNEQGEAVDLAQVKVTSLERHTPLSLTRFSQYDGKVRLPQAAGLEARVVVEAVGYVKLQKELTLGRSLRLTLTPSVRAVGRVLGVRGRVPATGARVTLQSGAVTRHAVVDDDGSYVISDVPRGAARLSASHDELGKASQAVQVKPGVRDRPAELPDLMLQPALHVRGRIEDDRGRRVSGAVIGGDRLSAYLPSGGAQILGRSQEDGTFEVEVEPASELYLYAAVLGEAFGWSDAIVPAGRDRLEDVVIVVDHDDVISPHYLATVLISLSERAGRLLVYAVADSSRARQDGLLAEDEVLRIDDQRVTKVEEARESLSGVAGTEVRLTVRRGGREKEITTTREVFLR